MRVVVVGALYGAIAVGLGAVGSHVLDGAVPVESNELLRTAVFYTAIHAAVMVAMGALKSHVLPILLGAASWAFGLGVFLFSGSLFAMTLGAAPELAYVTPVGGGLLIIGWLLLAVAAARRI
ncbi:DUF423 domain-containing protein [Acuticoccus kandeliae]|uniref:DUF423 domain-containing protein n=1 Tax=Acuticoccus kandeliae TaxID=2073160 RepID=UPI000D3E9999|nr:DUF423 domain-containing protein [Acuticoccus kandeliae]